MGHSRLFSFSRTLSEKGFIGGKTEEKDKENPNLEEIAVKTLKRGFFSRRFSKVTLRYVETLEETCAKINDLRFIAYRRYDRAQPSEQFPNPSNFRNLFQ